MPDHYFSETPAGATRPREIELELAGSTRKLLTAGGVFSPEHLDEGTRVLLRTLESRSRALTFPPSETAARILDLGCGWGPIALHAGLTAPAAEVWAIDVNARARELTVANAERLGLDRLRVASPDEVPEGLRFTEIRSNPPIRVGKVALHAMLGQWLARLETGGSAWLVVAKHLGAESLRRWIADEFPDFEVRRAARDKGFHVIEAQRH